MVERWTRQQRLERTRALLIDAAEEVFARKGFGAASLDDIAAVAGYTRGAIYVHFTAKEDLFLAVSDRYLRRYFANFTEALAAVTQLDDAALDDLADRWRQLARNGGARHAALGHEFSLYLVRNPEARARVADQRARILESLVEFVSTSAAELGLTLTIPVTTFAQLIIATSDSIMLASELDDADLYRPVLRMYTSALTSAGVGAR
ncbi:TetR family transcriptional regulator [Nocardia sp. NPDC005366]|uniref:TetR family transcriptional regulator n=1 Tax=Nocardia sp. NPDC005366 TaxID=3156878 RepID=UPI0033BB4B65